VQGSSFVRGPDFELWTDPWTLDPGPGTDIAYFLSV